MEIAFRNWWWYTCTQCMGFWSSVRSRLLQFTQFFFWILYLWIQTETRSLHMYQKKLWQPITVQDSVWLSHSQIQPYNKMGNKILVLVTNMIYMFQKSFSFFCRSSLVFLLHLINQALFLRFNSLSVHLIYHSQSHWKYNRETNAQTDTLK